MKLLKEYIKKLISEAEHEDDSSTEITNLFRLLAKKFPDDVGLAKAVSRQQTREYLSTNMVNRFWNDYDYNLVYGYGKKKYLKDTVAYFKISKEDSFLVNLKAIPKYIRDDLKEFDIFVFEHYYSKYQMSKERLKMIILAAKTFDEFKVLLYRVAKNI